MKPELILEANFSVHYRGKPFVVRDCDLCIRQGEILGLVGESGSGKSSIAFTLLGLIGLRGGTSTGKIVLQGRDLTQLTGSQWRAIRGRTIALVLQSPTTALNPALRIRTQMREAWGAHRKVNDAECMSEIRAAFRRVKLNDSDEFINRRPDQLSVGQAQRVLIAMALLHRPCLLICDEATSALDLITQAEIIRLLKDLNTSLGITMLYISHDLLSVRALCDRVAVLHRGSIVECGDVQQVFLSPAHAYTRQLTKTLQEFGELAQPAYSL